MVGKTKVRIKKTLMDVHLGANMGDIGYVDGYVTRNNCFFAAVVISDHIIITPYENLEVIK